MTGFAGLASQDAGPPLFCAPYSCCVQTETWLQRVFASGAKQFSREAGSCGEERLDRHAAAPLAMTTKHGMH
jgi:hypothetical protein